MPDDDIQGVFNEPSYDKVYACLPASWHTHLKELPAIADEEIPLADRLSDSDALKRTYAIMSSYGIKAAQDQLFLLLTLLKFFALNGSTRRLNGTYTIRVAGRPFSLNAALSVVRDVLRQWCRAYDELFYEEVCGGDDGLSSPKVHKRFIDALMEKFSTDDAKFAVGCIDFFTSGFLLKHNYTETMIKEITRLKQEKFAKAPEIKYGHSDDAYSDVSSPVSRKAEVVNTNIDWHARA